MYTCACMRKFRLQPLYCMHFVARFWTIVSITSKLSRQFFFFFFFRALFEPLSELDIFRLLCTYVTTTFYSLTSTSLTTELPAHYALLSIITGPNCYCVFKSIHTVYFEIIILFIAIFNVGYRKINAKTN